MNELQKFIVKKGLEKASLDVIKKAIHEDPQVSNDIKEFWIGVINGYSISKDIYDIMEFLKRNNWYLIKRYGYQFMSRNKYYEENYD